MAYIRRILPRILRENSTLNSERTCHRAAGEIELCNNKVVATKRANVLREREASVWGQSEMTDDAFFPHANNPQRQLS